MVEKSKFTIDFLWKSHKQDYRSWLCISAGVGTLTTLSYVSDLRGWHNFLSTQSTFLEGEEGIKSNLSEYLSYRSQHGAKETTLIRIISSSRSFFTYLIQMGIFEDSILLGLEGIKKHQISPRVLSWSQVQLLIDATNTSVEKAIVRILVFLGLRVSELITLRHENWNFEKKILLVYGKGNRERILPVPKVLWIDFDKSRTASGWIFSGKIKGTHLTRMSVWNLLQKLAKRCNLTEHIHPHIFRHTLATHLLEGGMDIFYIKELLGHADICSTEIYTHVRPHRLQKLLRDHHPLYY